VLAARHGRKVNTLDIRKVPAPISVEINRTDTGVPIPTLECQDITWEVGQIVLFQISNYSSDCEHN
jgi:hypothetical protein